LSHHLQYGVEFVNVDIEGPGEADRDHFFRYAVGKHLLNGNHELRSIDKANL